MSTNIMNQFAADYFEKRNGHKFNSSIMALRNQDSISDTIDKMCQEIEKVLPNNIKYMGFDILQNVEKSNYVKNKNPDKKIKKNTVIISNKETFYSTAVFKFKLKTVAYRKDGEVIEEMCDSNITINIPELFDSSNYLIKGNLYTPPIQIIESLVYTREDLVILKTNSKPLHFARKKCNIVDIDGNKYITHKYFITIGTKNIPFLLYYLSQFGFVKTLEYFGATKNDIKLFKIPDLKMISEEMRSKYYIFKFGLIYLAVDKEKFEKNISMRQFVASLLGIHKRVRSRIDDKYLADKSKLRTLLGSYINENKAYDKGVDLLKGFSDLLDVKTREIVSKLVKDGEFRGKNMFSVVRYLFFNFTNLTSSITDMNYKRFRIDEYVISLLMFTIQHKIFRFSNSKPKSQTLKKLQDICKVDPNILLNSLIGKIKNKKFTLDVVRYNTNVNDNSFLGSVLKLTLMGPSSLSSNSKRLPTSSRGFDLSSLEKIDLCSFSAGDPAHNSFSPMCEIDEDKKIFKKSLFEMNDEEYAHYLKTNERPIFVLP